MNGPASVEIAKLHCANNEVEDTRLSSPFALLISVNWPMEVYMDQSAQYEVVW